VLSTTTFLIVYFIPEPLIKIFSNDPELVSVGAYAAKRMFLAMPLMGVVMVSTQVFQALGKAVQAFITAIVRPLVFLIPASLLLPRLWQIDGVWLAFPSSDMLATILMVVLLIPIFRQFNREAKKEDQRMQTETTSGQILDTAGNPATD
jgi:Na+-driven multidrug efflux pump